jgi:hypothetical protein
MVGLEIKLSRHLIAPVASGNDFVICCIEFASGIEFYVFALLVQKASSYGFSALWARRAPNSS